MYNSSIFYANQLILPKNVHLCIWGILNLSFFSFLHICIAIFTGVNMRSKGLLWWLSHSCTRSPDTLLFALVVFTCDAWEVQIYTVWVRAELGPRASLRHIRVQNGLNDLISVSSVPLALFSCSYWEQACQKACHIIWHIQSDRSVHLRVTCVCGKPTSQSQVSKTCPSLLRNFYIVRPSFICMYTVFSCEEAALDVLSEVSGSKEISLLVMP